MNFVLAAAETNSYFSAFIGFVGVMIIVGFFVMRADKKRWLNQVARSEEMEHSRKKKKKPAEGEVTAEGEAAVAADADAAEAKGKKKKKPKKVPEGYVDNEGVRSNAYQYKGMLPDSLLFAIALFFGAIGEIFAMIIYRHRWYKWSFRIFMPACVVLNIVLAVLFAYLLSSTGTDSVLSN